MSKSHFLPTTGALRRTREKLSVLSYDEFTEFVAEQLGTSNSNVEDVLRKLPDPKVTVRYLEFVHEVVDYDGKESREKHESQTSVIEFIPSAANLNALLAPIGYELYQNELTHDLNLITPFEIITSLSQIHDEVNKRLLQMYGGEYSIQYTSEPFVDRRFKTVMPGVANVKTPIKFSKLDLKDAYPAIFDSVCRHPVRDWILSADWDGQSRVQQYFDTIPSKDKLKETYMLKWAVSLCAALFHGTDGASTHPGNALFKNIEGVLTLQGGQGKNKSTWFQMLFPAGSGFGGNSVQIDTNNKDSKLEALRQCVTEIGEFEAVYKKSSIEQLKDFTTKPVDYIRPPYGTSHLKFPRRTIFGASANTSSFLQDTENRRFWTLEIDRGGKLQFLNDQLDAAGNVVMAADDVRQQFWAEIYTQHYLKGQIHWLTDEDRTEQRASQVKFEDKGVWDQFCDKHITEPTEHNPGKLLNPASIIRRLLEIENLRTDVAPGNDVNRAIGKWLTKHNFPKTANGYYKIVVEENIGIKDDPEHTTTPKAPVVSIVGGKESSEDKPTVKQRKPYMPLGALTPAQLRKQFADHAARALDIDSDDEFSEMHRRSAIRKDQQR